MKKKGLILFLIIICLFAVTGCDKKKESTKKEKEDNTTRVMEIPTAVGALVYSYPKQNSFSLKTEQLEEYDGIPAIRNTIFSNDLAIGMVSGTTEISYIQYKNIVKELKKEKNYEEYKLDNYEAYIYDVADKTLLYNILIEKDEETDSAIITGGEVFYVYQPKNADIKKEFTKDVIKDFFDSLKLEKAEY